MLLSFSLISLSSLMGVCVALKTRCPVGEATELEVDGGPILCSMFEFLCAHIPTSFHKSIDFIILAVDYYEPAHKHKAS